MNNRRDVTMTLAKYTAYSGIILAVFFENKDSFIESVLLCSFLITIGSIRQFVLEDRLEFLKKYTFIVDLVIVTMLGLLKYNSIFVIGYYIILVESLLICPFILGTVIAFTSLGCYLGVYFVNNDFKLLGDSRAFIVYNCLSFVFFYFISVSTKRQLEQKERLLITIDKLEKSKEDLESAYESLIQGNKKLQEVTILEERNRVAREIHDTLAHTLTTIIVEIEAGMKLMVKGSDGTSKELIKASEELQKAQNQARVGLDEVRYSIKNLRSGILNREGFRGALQMTLGQLRSEHDVEINMVLGEDLDINDEYEMALFRIIQEAATNSFRHGKCKRLEVDLNRCEDKLILSIKDDGIGCSHIKAGYGLVGIKERVKKLGGSVDIETEPGSGFRISVVLPNLE